MKKSSLEVSKNKIIKYAHMFCNVNYKLAPAIGTCHLPLQELNHVLQLLTFNTPLKGAQSGEQK